MTATAKVECYRVNSVGVNNNEVCMGWDGVKTGESIFMAKLETET